MYLGLIGRTHGTLPRPASRTSGSLRSGVAVKIAVVLASAAAIVLMPATAGATWSIQQTALAPGTTEGTLSGVSCVSLAQCVAVGEGAVFEDGMLDAESFLGEEWNGSAWTVLPGPAPAGERSFLSGVSCVSATYCVAVGTVGPISGDQTQPLIELWNGVTWSELSAPIVAGQSGSLQGVACSSTAACIAVGRAERDNGFHGASWRALVERWNGTAWTTQRTPRLAAGHNASLTAVSCPTASQCIAVGGVQLGSASANSKPLVERWNGRRWTLESVPHPAAALLQGVACTSPANCLAVGSDVNDQTATAPAVAEHWNGRSWVSARFSTIRDVIGDLTSISCASPTACTAVGMRGPGVIPTSFKRELLAYEWNGKSWMTGRATEAEGGSAALMGVSCVVAGGCTAVGQSSERATLRPLAEHVGP